MIILVAARAVRHVWGERIDRNQERWLHATKIQQYSHQSGSPACAVRAVPHVPPDPLAINSDSMPILLLAVLMATCLAAHAGAQSIGPQFNDGEAHGDAPYLVEDGWTPLLNGKDVSGWHGMGSESNEWFTTRGILW